MTFPRLAIAALFCAFLLHLMPEAAAQNAAPPPQNKTAQDNANQAVASTDKEPTPSKKGPVEDAKPKVFTMMFNPQNVERVNTVIEAFANGDSTEEETAKKEDESDILDQILKEIPKKIMGETDVVAPTIYPSFFLSSIMYYGPNEWAIWLNGFKISNRTNKTESPLYVSAINKNKVEIVWKPDAILLNDLKDIRSRFEKHDNRVPLADDGKSVVFILKPNQTFVSSIMSIEEGKIPSVTAELSETDKEKNKKAAKANDSQAPNAPMPPMSGSYMDSNPKPLQPAYKGAKEVMEDTLTKSMFGK